MPRYAARFPPSHRVSSTRRTAQDANLLVDPRAVAGGCEVHRWFWLFILSSCRLSPHCCVSPPTSAETRGGSFRLQFSNGLVKRKGFLRRTPSAAPKPCVAQLRAGRRRASPGPWRGCARVPCNDLFVADVRDDPQPGGGAARARLRRRSQAASSVIEATTACTGARQKRESAGIMLDQNADEPLERAEDCRCNMTGTWRAPSSPT